MGTMWTQYSNNERSSHNNRSSSATRNVEPILENSTRCSVRATADVGSSCTCPRSWTASPIEAGRGDDSR